MATAVIRIDTPPKGIEVTGEGSNPTDEQMREEEEARQEFLDSVGPKLAALPGRPPRRSGNVSRVELLGTNVWSELNHYLLLIEVDIGDPDIDLDELVPPGGSASVIGSYEPLEQWPEEDATAGELVKFEISPDRSGKYRWRLVARNGQTVASSGEAFDSKSNARRAAENVRDNAGSADIDEQ